MMTKVACLPTRAKHVEHPDGSMPLTENVLNLKLVAPEETHLIEITAWLSEENDLVGEGFFCNLNVIGELFSEGNAICATLDGRTVGFITFQIFAKSSKLQIIEVHPKFRNRGIGGALIDSCIDAIRSTGSPIIEVQCTSLDGELLCRSRGFVDHQDPRTLSNSRRHKSLRKSLSP